MAVTVTKTTIAALNVEQTFTANAATSSTIDQAEVFTITPTKSAGKYALFFYNGSGHGAITYSIAAGGMWGAKAVTGSIAAGATEVLQLDDYKVKKSDGTLAVTLTPASGKRLLTDHAAGMYVLELIG
jgi:hypothetical protein